MRIENYFYYEETPTKVNRTQVQKGAMYFSGTFTAREQQLRTGAIDLCGSDYYGQQERTQHFSRCGGRPLAEDPYALHM